MPHCGIPCCSTHGIVHRALPTPEPKSTPAFAMISHGRTLPSFYISMRCVLLTRRLRLAMVLDSGRNVHTVYSFNESRPRTDPRPWGVGSVKRVDDETAWILDCQARMMKRPRGASAAKTRHSPASRQWRMHTRRVPHTWNRVAQSQCRVGRWCTTHDSELPSVKLLGLRMPPAVGWVLPRWGGPASPAQACFCACGETYVAWASRSAPRIRVSLNIASYGARHERCSERYASEKSAGELTNH
ncbi:hypothetical protein B0H16DRAFT_1600609 [Mycena metata]|uniref:Uncharacterized protein n=1 Tax=Mycena metata TaxID=1033252 RepID=A0AAD7ML27_9AGAR|nr:hypothetical protein B0H16DRAFT_1600609 [Mycena metata]